MADSIKARLRSSSKSDLEMSEDDVVASQRPAARRRMSESDGAAVPQNVNKAVPQSQEAGMPQTVNNPVPQSQDPTVPQQNNKGVPQFVNTGVPQYKNSTVPLSEDTTVPLFRDSTVPLFQGTGGASRMQPFCEDLEETVIATRHDAETEDESTVCSSFEDIPERPRPRAERPTTSSHVEGRHDTRARRLLHVAMDTCEEPMTSRQATAERATIGHATTKPAARKASTAFETLLASANEPHLSGQHATTLVQPRYVMDDGGFWMTFNVPEGHRLFGTYIPTRKEDIPASACVDYVPGVGTPARFACSSRQSEKTREEPQANAEAQRKDETDSVTSERDIKIKELELELARVKADLRASTAVEGTTVPQKRVGFSRRNKGNESAYDTANEVVRHRRHRVKTDTEVSQTEYDTCVETDATVREPALPRMVTPRRKRTRANGRTSESESMASSASSKGMMTVFRECVKDTIAALREEVQALKTTDACQANVAKENVPPRSTQAAAREANTTIAKGTPQPEGGGPLQAATPDLFSPESMDMGITDVRSLAPPPRPMAVSQNNSMPFMTIAKFDGEYWSDFIEYYESVADANCWSEKEKLTYLLMSIDGKARAYAKGERGVPQTYTNVKQRLESRYGQHEPAFQVRQQLREIRRRPNERLEDFADRLQIVAQKGNLDPRDRNELFYQAFLTAVKGSPKLQHFIEQEHRVCRDLTLSDLLSLTRRYMDRHPTELVQGGPMAVNVCKPITQRKGELTHEDEDVKTEVVAEQHRVDEERQDRKRVKEEVKLSAIEYLEKEVAFLKRCVKDNRLHHNLKPLEKKDDADEATKKKKFFNKRQDHRAGVRVHQAGVNAAALAAPAAEE